MNEDQKNDVIKKTRNILKIYRKAKYIYMARKSVKEMVDETEIDTAEAMCWLQEQKENSFFVTNNKQIIFMEKALAVIDSALEYMKEHHPRKEYYHCLYAHYICCPALSVGQQLDYMERQNVFVSAPSYYRYINRAIPELAELLYEYLS